MNAQDLKNSILQLAIQGKLVEQRPEEGTAQELLAQIKAEKEQLIKEKKIKKEKTLPEITDDEIPFEIPTSWEWVRHNDLFEIVGGSQPPKSFFKSYPMENHIRLYQIRDYGEKPVPVYVPSDKVTKFTQKGDILLARYGASVGKVFWAENGAYNVAMARVVKLFANDSICNVYLYYYYLAPIYQSLVKQNSRSAQAGFNKEDLDSLLFPLPPLSEQKRIVAKIEEILPYIELYEKSYTKLESFNKKFPEDMKKSILRIAMQGKLVEQRAEEGTADGLYEQIVAEKEKLIKEGKIKKEKSLPEITEDEIPFEIPRSWKWVRFSEVIDVRDGTHDSPRYYDEGIPLVTSKNISGGGLDFSNVKYISKEDADKINARSNVDSGDILFAMIGTIGNPVIVNKDREFCVKNVALFKNYAGDKIDVNYVYWFLSIEQYSLKKIASGGVQAFIPLKVFRNYLMPLPPFDEQKRIVARIEEILPYCDQLIKR